MLTKYRRHLTFPKVTATLALFFALGTGGAYAADTIGSSDIINESILSQDIKNAEVKGADVAENAITSTKINNGSIINSELGANAVTSAKVLDNNLTGADVLESSLGKVGDADTVDGKHASELEVRAYGRIDPAQCAGPGLEVCTVYEAKNVTYAQRNSTGNYCIKVPGATGHGEGPLIATVDSQRTAVPSGNTSVMSVEEGYCAGDEFVVQTSRQPTVVVPAQGGGTVAVAGNAVFASDVAFSFIVP